MKTPKEGRGKVIKGWAIKCGNKECGCSGIVEVSLDKSELLENYNPKPLSSELIEVLITLPQKQGKKSK